MIPLKAIFLLVSVFLIVGTSGAIGVFEDSFYFIMCGGCPEGASAFGGSVSAILTAGQSDVSFGVNGLLQLQDVLDDPAKAQIINETLGGDFKKSTMDGMILFYWTKIILGSLLTLIYIWVLIKLIKFPFKFATSFDPPLFVTIFLALAITGLLHFIFTGFTEIPFQGWITLAYHPELWTAKAIEAVSPLPPEALGNLTYPNSSVSLPT